MFKRPHLKKIKLTRIFFYLISALQEQLFRLKIEDPITTCEIRNILKKLKIFYNIPITTRTFEAHFLVFLSFYEFWTFVYCSQNTFWRKLEQKTRFSTTIRLFKIMNFKRISLHYFRFRSVLTFFQHTLQNNW